MLRHNRVGAGNLEWPFIQFSWSYVAVCIACNIDLGSHVAVHVTEIVKELEPNPCSSDDTSLMHPDYSPKVFDQSPPALHNMV